MSKVSYSKTISQKRDFGKKVVCQEMVITVEYDESDQSVSDPEVHIYQDGKYLAEVSYLLEHVEGNPLEEMITSIDWREQHTRQHKLISSY